MRGEGNSLATDTINRGFTRATFSLAWLNDFHSTFTRAFPRRPAFTSTSINRNGSTADSLKLQYKYNVEVRIKDRGIIDSGELIEDNAHRR